MRRRGAGAKHGNSERWLLTYADLITLLLVFFVVIYSISRTDADRLMRVGGSLQRAFNLLVLEGATPGLGTEKGAPVQGDVPQPDEFAFLRDDLTRRMPAGRLPDGVTVELVREGILIRLASGVLFTSGRADLKSEASPVLDAVAGSLRTMPNKVRVEGHTDAIPIATPLFPSNWELSVARALGVVHYLIERGGLKAERVGAAGYGEFRPVADNATRESRARNRRADILILYPDARLLQMHNQPAIGPAAP